MNRTTSRIALGMLGLVASLRASAASAGADTIRVEGKVDEVTVAGVKTNRHNLTAASVSVVGASLMRTHTVTDMTDLSGLLPNVFVTDYGSKQTTPIAIRGIMSKAKGTTVGFYVDGVPHFEVSSFDADMLDVKSIEVYRGPQGTLYGRNTLGGVINIYTISPFDSQGTTVRAGGGNHGTATVQASHRSLLTERMGLGASAYYKHCNGYFQNEHLGRKADKTDEAGGRISLHWRPTDTFSAALTSNVDYVDQGGYAYAPYDVETGRISPVSYDSECGFRRMISTSGLGLHFALPGVSINSQTSFQWLDENVTMDQDFSPSSKIVSHLDVSQTAMSEEIVAKSDNNSRLQWVAGLFAFRQTRSNTSEVKYIKNGYTSVNDYNIQTSGVSLFAQASYNIFGGLSATVGLRYDHEKSLDDHQNYKQRAESRDDATEFHSAMRCDDVLPKVGIRYTWGKQNMAFGNVTRGCKAGGFNSVFQTDAERTYDDEDAWNYELGVRMGTRRLSGEATLFFIDWRNQHISRAVTGLGTIICNAGHTTSRGIEASVVARPVTGLLIQANWGFTYAKFEDYKKSDEVDYSGKMVPLVPRNTITGLVNYSFAPRRGLDLLSFSVNAGGIGKLYWLEDNEVCQPFYALLGAKASAKKGCFSLDIWGRNLTNTHYLAYYFVSSAKFAQDGLPTRLGVTLTVSF